MDRQLPEVQAGSGGPDEGRGDRSIVGLWHLTFLINGVAVNQGFRQWHSDGTEILNDTAPPVTGNVCLGVWVQTGRRTYRLKHPAWRFDAAGNLIGTQLLREEVTLARGGNSFTASATLEFFDLSGNKVGELPPGEVRGERITVD
jgi:hypothetical protein